MTRRHEIVRYQHGQLTPREREVADLLAQGKAQREIAERLVISRRTAYVHVRRVCEKVGARSVMEAAVLLATNAFDGENRLNL